MDIIRHASLFEPTNVRGDIAVIGVGALGSALAIQLAKLGLQNLVLFDADTVEQHNLPNQILYGPEDIGRPKVEAARDTIDSLTGYMPDIVNDNLNSKIQLRGVTHVFVCVDSMTARKDIFDRCIFLNPNVTFYCEGRMNAREGIVTTFDPTDIEKAKEYQRRLYPDSDVPLDLGTCGNVLSLGATAMTIACQMVWALINTHGTGTRANRSEELSFAVHDLAVHHKGPLT